MTCEHCLHSILYNKSGMGVGLSVSAVCYPPTIHSFGIVRPFVRPSTLFVHLEPYLSTYWSDLMHS